MIAYIRGELASVEEDRVIVDVAGGGIWHFLCREHPLDCCPL
mgnify:CR=1 FL=1